MASEEMAYYLTEEDVKTLQLMRQQVLAGNPARRAPAKGREEQEDYAGAEVYVVLTPPAGIPALDPYHLTTGTGTHHATDDIPGRADCYIYTIQDADEEPGSGTGTPGNLFNNNLNNLLPVQIKVPVYNLSTTAVPGNSWRPVVRDKFGHWIVGAVEAGASSGYSPHDCGTVPPTMTNGAGAVTLIDQTSETTGQLFPNAGVYIVTFDLKLTAITGNAQATFTFSVTPKPFIANWTHLFFAASLTYHTRTVFVTMGSGGTWSLTGQQTGAASLGGSVAVGALQIS